MSITLEGCACRKDSVIILEDAVVDDTGIVYATDTDIERLFEKTLTPDPTAMAETRKVVDVDRLAHYKTLEDAANTEKFALKTDVTVQAATDEDIDRLFQ